MIIWWIGEAEPVVPYDPELHAGKVKKFLYWAEGSGGPVIVAGPQIAHKTLLQCAHYADRAREPHGKYAPLDEPDGAGTASGANVTSWDSEGFGFETPENLRPVIKEGLGLS